MVIEFTLSLLLSLGVPFAVEEQYCYEKIIMVDNIKDFGVVSWASVLKHTFTLKNVSDEEICLRVIKPWCSCTRVSYKTLKIPKQGRLDIDIEYDVDTSSGYFDKSIMVLVVGKNKPLFLKIRGYIGEH